MQRRYFIAGLAGSAVAWPFAARAQRAARTYRVALLSPGGRVPNTDERRMALVRALAERGYVEGRNLVFEDRFSEGRGERLPGLAAELNAARVDVIVTIGYPAALAAKQSAPDLPVVMISAGDPVETGLVEGLARPGGHVTGMTELSTELSAKRLELLKEAIPRLGVVAMLWNVDDLAMSMRYRAAENAARVLDVKVQTLGVREPNDFDLAFAAMSREPPDAILMVSDVLTLLNRKRVVDFASANKLPTIFEDRRSVRDGGMMSYGPTLQALGERAGDFVARILRGARPADLPLEQPTIFELVVNLKTAKALGVNLPALLVARADEVIE
jgi:putative tryptophan/tyrosine transport system substrate-binding protein